MEIWQPTGRQRRSTAPFSTANLSGNRKPLGLAEASLHFVILGRSKERSDAAQTLGSMPLPKPKNAAAQNGTCIRNGARYPSPMTGYAT
ncbi:MAG: hypothetical protein EOS83_26570 [Mesorhizobium sp.]|nr:MAG: hypothetical protein EOS83_26570 [Mesorhizobium sp.]